MASSRFSYSTDTLQQLATQVLDHAKRGRATDCELDISEGFGQTVTVRLGETETIEYNRDKGLGITVYFGQKKGYASTSDFSAQSLQDSVNAAISIAKFTANDDCAGLADSALLARQPMDLALYHPWELDVEQAIALAQECESSAMAVDSRISNSEGASISTQESHFIYANSRGFMQGYPGSRHSISAAVIAGKDSTMQRDYWYSTARSANKLDSAINVGKIAGERAVRRLNGRQVSTQQVPVLFEAPLAAGLIGHFVSAVSGGSLYRKSSFLLDSLGQTIFSPLVNLYEEPHLSEGLASSPFDNEGVATSSRDLVKDGILQGYFLGSYSARKLGMTSTGNAGGNHNLLLQSGQLDFAGLLQQMQRGLVVTELLGHGVNPVTGDYSRGAAGFWVENGQIQYPVEEITIAGNLKDMFRQIVAIGNDQGVYGSKHCGSILIEQMMVAGN